MTLTPRKSGFRLSTWFILASVLFFFQITDKVFPESLSGEGWSKSSSVLLMSDGSDDLENFREKLEEGGWHVSRLTQEGFLASEEYLDFSIYGSLIVYIHQPLHPVVEEALISYAEMGGKLLLLHHTLASAKIENPEWLKFLGVTILPGDKKFPWIVTANTSHVLVNLAPGHYITSHQVHYDREVDFSFAGRPDLEGTFPAFQLEDTEIFHNQLLSDDKERVFLFGYRMIDGKQGKIPGQPVIPRMEPTSGWYKPAGKGWVFYLQPGHTELDFENRSFFQVILNCLNWEPNNPDFSSSPCLAHSPEFVTVDLNLHENRLVTLPDGNQVSINVESLKHYHDSARDAVRKAEARVRVNDQVIVLDSGMYSLPREVSGIQIDCPVTSGWVHGRDVSVFNPWSLESDVRLRLWPGKKAWIDPDTFSYPVDAAWFSSDTQMTNDPCYVDRGDLPDDPGSLESNIYYHYGLDVGGSEGQTVIRSAVDGLVVSAGDETLLDYRKNTPVEPRYDVIYILDSRGWLCRYSHFYSINPGIKPGFRVRKGEKLGLLGKEGGSGGWSHFHFGINSRQPSGKFGAEDGYAFYWQSYFTGHPGKIQAVARPHQILQAGEEIILDGSRSRSFQDHESDLFYKWSFSDGSVSDTMVTRKKYDFPGYYSEILQVTDRNGNIDYDFCPVYVLNPGKSKPDQPLTIHAVFHPTLGIKAGEEITFKVRSFGIDPRDGKEIWNFGDGSPEVEVCSDGNAEVHNPEGYAVIRHKFSKPGCYLVSVSRTSNRNYTATARLKVVVGE